MSGAPSRTDLFLGYVKIGLLGFGGVAPWARRRGTKPADVACRLAALGDGLVPLAIGMVLAIGLGLITYVSG